MQLTVGERHQTRFVGVSFDFVLNPSRLTFFFDDKEIRVEVGHG